MQSVPNFQVQGDDGKAEVLQRQVTGNAHCVRMDSGFTLNRHNRPISAHFHSGGEEFTCFGDDLGEAVC